MGHTPGESRPARPEDPCQAREVLGTVGDKWSLLIVRNLSQGPRRFTEFRNTTPHDTSSSGLLTPQDSKQVAEVDPHDSSATF